MSVRGYDGLEHHGTTVNNMLTAGWTAVATGSIISSDKRTGTYCFQFSVGTSGFLRNYDNIAPDCRKAGFAIAWKTAHGAPGNFVITQYRNSSGRALISLQIDALGRILVIRGGLDALSAAGTQIGASTDTLEPNTWNHIESEVYINDTTGYVKIRVNGKDFYELLNVDTNGPVSGDDVIRQFGFGCFDTSASSGVYASAMWDDSAWWDDEVDTHHDGSFIGQHGVTYLPALADGAYEEWTPSSGADSAAMVDEISPDEDSTYVVSDTFEQRASFDCAVPPANVDDIECLMVVVRAKKTDSGDADIAMGVITQGAVESDGDAVAVTNDYYTRYTLFPSNPETSGQWNPAAMPEAKVTNKDPTP